MGNSQVAIMIYGEPGSKRNALTEEKYSKLVEHFIRAGINVDSVVYNDSLAEEFETTLLKYKAILVWINPIEQGKNRIILDSLLNKLSGKGCFISCHPDTIMKMGTKDILYKTRNTDFGGDIRLYHSFEDFKERFIKNFSNARILKQHRGNGGNGVFKIETNNKEEIIVTDAKDGNSEIVSSVNGLMNKFKSYFTDGGLMVDQPWNLNLTNGMVRCYLSGDKVAGFGFQEINALYPLKKPSQRFYFTEDCGLFQDLRQIMEEGWINILQTKAGVSTEMLPVIWDADFFINKVNADKINEKYTLCEINVSCVSPFPESSIPYIVDAVKAQMK